MKPHYRCDNCDSLYENEDEAYDCCPQSVSVRWVCPVCESAHSSEDEAESCCPSDGPPPLTAAEMEAAGQLRLIP